MQRLSEAAGIHVLRVSSFYRTEPLGVTDQDWFVNAAVEIRTLLPPRQLLDVLLGIEDAMGRRRKARWGPRVIDLDLLFYGQAILSEPGLIVPHPEAH
ncbi:MAG TPA: 2-amino-4-hydroxy-6-hydroxymethyldihydropteridine diphosphokinase, partial [Syntrophales bacterium]|nr:2-amino-4-hydroxy-6-hydroxymethyldihydropteridine diphosphokinase [Syntrophales bacterium]